MQVTAAESAARIKTPGAPNSSAAGATTIATLMASPVAAEAATPVAAGDATTTRTAIGAVLANASDAHGATADAPAGGYSTVVSAEATATTAATHDSHVTATPQTAPNAGDIEHHCG